jgi:segregation and condensation protein B
MTEQDDMTIDQIIQGEQLQNILEAALLAAGQPLSPAQLAAIFSDEERPPKGEISRALEQLRVDCGNRGIELKKVASGYRLQVKQEYNEWVSRLWKERPPRYSRALLETIALIAYRQPITRGEIESVRGVSVSTNIIRTLQEREWIRVVGHRDVPGKPALFGTTNTFLDSFDLQNLDDLPTLAEIRDMENLEPELQLEAPAPSVATENLDEDTDTDEDEDIDDYEDEDIDGHEDEDEDEDDYEDDEIGVNMEEEQLEKALDASADRSNDEANDEVDNEVKETGSDTAQP